MKPFVTYLRVSTAHQGAEGLGIQAQRTAVQRIVEAEGELLAEFIEVQSGRKSKERPQLSKALALCKETGATLLIARLDRLTRNVKFLYELMESGVQFRASDVAEFNPLILGMLIVVAEYEASLTSKRTKVALEEKRAKSGEWRTGRRKDGSIVLNKDIRELALKVRRAKAEAIPMNKMSESMVRSILMNQPDGMSLSAIAGILNDGGFKTPTGKDWNKQAVKRIKDKLAVK